MMKMMKDQAWVPVVYLGTVLIEPTVKASGKVCADKWVLREKSSSVSPRNNDNEEGEVQDKNRTQSAP